MFLLIAFFMLDAFHLHDSFDIEDARRCQNKLDQMYIFLCIEKINLFFFDSTYLDTGDMTTMERDTTLKNITENDKCTVIIVSILAGGVGEPII